MGAQPCRPCSQTSSARSSRANSVREGEEYELVEESDDSSSFSDGDVELANAGIILQFTSQLYFVDGDEPIATIDVMRLGSQSGRVSCRFQTEDMTGKAGERYESTDTKVVFEAGELQKSIPIPLVPSDRWAVTLEFKGVLSQPKGCTIGHYLHTCRCKVIDNHKFPSARFSVVGQGMAALKTFGILSLFWEYCKMNFAVPGMAWRTLVYIFFDQMKNVYLFYKLWALAYMLNVIFRDASGSVFTIDARANQAVLIGLGYILPMIVLHAWELAKVRIDISGHSRVFLQDCIITKYLNYDDESRVAVSVAEIQVAVREGALDMANGYVAALDVLKTFGKLIVMLYFTLGENPRAMGAVLTMPALMIGFAYFRHGVLSNAFELPNDLGTKVVAFVGDLARNYRLIASYHQRPRMNDMFGHKVSAWRLALTSPATVEVNNDFFTQWLGPLFVGVYIMTRARSVLSGEIGQGTFIAMLRVFDEISAAFTEGYSQFLKISAIGGSIRGVVEILNRSTDLPVWKMVNRKRRARTQMAREDMFSARAISQFSNGGCAHHFPTDLIKFDFNDVGFAVDGEPILQDINLSVAQGGVVAIIGQHGHGRQTFLKLIAHEIFPTDGEICIPTHLRLLCVSQEIQILESSLILNLTLGHHTTPDVAHIEHVANVLEKLEAWKLLKKVRETLMSITRSDSEESDEDTVCGDCCRAEDNVPDDDVEIVRLDAISYSEKAKLHLARAFLVNPEVLVLQRPLIHFSHPNQKDVLDLIHEHVRNRGIGLPPETAHLRRPRTVFISVESKEQAKGADVIWEMVKVTDSSSSVVVVSDASV